MMNIDIIKVLMTMTKAVALKINDNFDTEIPPLLGFSFLYFITFWDDWQIFKISFKYQICCFLLESQFIIIFAT